MSQKDYSRETDTEKKKEDWMNSKWRPMMGWMYMGVCIFDFVLAPILWTAIQAVFHGGINTQWQPLTLQGGGLFHVAMGAVIGISAYGRTQEKLNGANNGGIVPAGQPMGTQYVPPGGMPGQMGGMQGGMNNGMGGGFGGSTGGFGGSTGGFGGQTNGGFNSSSSGASTFGAPSAGFGAPAGGFGSTTSAPASGGFGATAPSTPTAAGGFGSGFNGGSGAIPATQAPAAIQVTASGHKMIPPSPQPAL
jgi:hypothetical protein